MAAAGSVLAFRAVKPSRRSTESDARTTFLLNSTPEQAYTLWRDFEKLPRFMRHIKSVRNLGDTRSEWVALGPMEAEVRWQAEITEDQPNQRIAWRSLPQSMVQTSGSVEFTPDPLARGTYITAQVRYSAPGGAAGSALASMLGKHPEFMMREDVRRFKTLLETGEVPTTLGQSHGPRGMHGASEQFLFRETANLPDPQAAGDYRRSA
jgi:uncharacterized membrane protein